MFKVFNVVKRFTALLLIFLLISCSNAGSSSSDNSVANKYPYILGSTSNGGILSTTESSYILSGDQQVTGTISFTGPPSTPSGEVTMVVVPVNATIPAGVIESGLPTVSIPNCILYIDDSSSGSTCNFTLSSTESTVNGDYNVIPTFTQSYTEESQQLNPISLTVINAANPTPGQITIIPNIESLIPGESATATIVLSDSIGVFESVVINVSGSNNSVLTVTPASCNLNTQSNSCQVTLSALLPGTTMVTASAANYQSVQTSFNVVNPSSYVYTANGDGTISTYAMNPNNGQLISSGITTTTRVYTNNLAVTPSGKYLYAANQLGDCLLMYSISSINGQLIPLNPSCQSAESNPYAIAIDPSGRYLYTDTIAGNNSAAIAYSIEPTGLLLLNTTPASTGLNSRGIVVDATGKYLYVVSSSGNTIFLYSINSNTGGLFPLSPESTIATGNAPYAIAADPTGNYIYVTNSVDNTILSFQESENGNLTPIGSPVATGNDPVSLAVTPSGKFAYAVNFRGNSVSMYIVNPQNGILTPLSPDLISAGSGAWNIIIDPTGHYAYVTNRVSYTISMYSINQTSGILTPLTPSNVATRPSPFGIAIATPGGVSNVYHSKIKDK